MQDIPHLEKTDKEFIWHPFTQMRDWGNETPVIIDRGRGSFLVDTYGRRYLDGVSSLWVNIHGHRRKEINTAIKKQLDKIAHSTMLGLSNVPAIELAEKLVRLIGQSMSVTDNGDSLSGQGQRPALTKVFYSDNGSTAVEVALKMAFQYWKHRGVEGKNSFVSLRNGYHGDTLGAVSVGGIDIFHGVFGPLLFPTFKAPSPHCYRCEFGLEHPGCGLSCADQMEELLKSHKESVAAVILEPLVQAAGGMIVFPPGYLGRVRELCTRYGVLLIADEVATGFGRTGRMFACEHEAVIPDIICLSKGITGGYLPLAATIATDEIYNVFLGEFRDLKTLFHGHSYTGNPLACAAALASLAIFERDETLKGLWPKISLLEKRLEALSRLPHVGNVRNMGFMAGIELVRDKEKKEPYGWEEKMGWKVTYSAREKGVFMRPLGNVLVIMPPLSIRRKELDQLLTVIEHSITESCR